MIYEKLIKLCVGAVVFCFCLSSPAPAGTVTYSYDNLNRLIGVQSGEGTITYTYDAVGNRVTKQVTAPSGGAAAPAAEVTPGSAPAPAAVTAVPQTGGSSRVTGFTAAAGYLEWPGFLRRIREAGTAGELELLQQDLKDDLEQSGLSPEEKTRYQEVAAQELEARTDYLRGESAAAGEAAGKESAGTTRKRETGGERPHRKIQVDKGKIYTTGPEGGAGKPRP